MNVGMHRLFFDCACNDKMLKIKVSRKIMGVFKSRSKTVSVIHGRLRFVVFFKSGKVSLVSNFDTDFPD